jgi:hypothetical protein
MKRLFFRAKISALSLISLWLERINHFVVEYIFVTSKKIQPPPINVGLKELCKKSDAVIKQAKEYSKKSNFTQNEEHLAYYYYLLKHYSSIYESYFGLIPPVQVFNEHRMALDHFIRAKASNDDKHIGKATDHILRGLLDILKLNCAELKKIISKRYASFSLKVWGGVSDGEYIKKYAKLQYTAESLLYEAKCCEYHLENAENSMVETANKFIYAFAAHNEWYEFQSKKMGEAIFHLARYYMIKGITVIASIATGVVACYIFSRLYNAS